MIELLDEMKIEPTSTDIKNDIYHKWILWISLRIV